MDKMEKYEPKSQNAQNYVCSRRGGCRRTQYRVVAERNFLATGISKRFFRSG